MGVGLAEKHAVIRHFSNVHQPMPGRDYDFDWRPAFSNGGSELQAIHSAGHVYVRETAA